MLDRSIFKNWFMTPSQKKQQSEAYFRKMFPFGEKQKKWEDNIIENIYSNNKNIIPTIKYMCYTRREMMIEGIINDETFIKKYKKLCKRMKLSENDINFIEQFTKIEHEVKSFSDLPDIKTIKERCSQYGN